MLSFKILGTIVVVIVGHAASAVFSSLMEFAASLDRYMYLDKVPPECCISSNGQLTLA